MTTRVIGTVNWFDSKKWFGFITVVTPEIKNTGKDIFVHFSNVNSKEDNYKRLYPGEYVEFEIRDTSDNRGPGCFEVTGPYGGNLLTDNERHRYKVYPKNNHYKNEEEGGATEEQDTADDDTEN